MAPTLVQATSALRVAAALRAAELPRAPRGNELLFRLSACGDLPLHVCDRLEWEEGLHGLMLYDRSAAALPSNQPRIGTMTELSLPPEDGCRGGRIRSLGFVERHLAALPMGSSRSGQSVRWRMMSGGFRDLPGDFEHRPNEENDNDSTATFESPVGDWHESSMSEASTRQPDIDELLYQDDEVEEYETIESMELREEVKPVRIKMSL